jgi:hypothetical protein
VLIGVIEAAGGMLVAQRLCRTDAPSAAPAEASAHA